MWVKFTRTTCNLGRWWLWLWKWNLSVAISWDREISEWRSRERLVLHLFRLALIKKYKQNLKKSSRNAAVPFPKIALLNTSWKTALVLHPKYQTSSRPGHHRPLHRWQGYFHLELPHRPVEHHLRRLLHSLGVQSPLHRHHPGEVYQVIFRTDLIGWKMFSFVFCYECALGLRWTAVNLCNAACPMHVWNFDGLVAFNQTCLPDWRGWLNPATNRENKRKVLYRPRSLGTSGWMGNSATPILVYSQAWNASVPSLQMRVFNLCAKK